MKRISTLLQISFALSLLPLAAMANPGALEINQDCAAVGCFAGDTPGFPVTITQPGSYVLTSDLAPDFSNEAISVGASPVDIDLNAHTIDGGGSCTGSPVTTCTGFVGYRGIDANSNGPIVMHIHNGTVRGFSSGGIVIFYADDGTLLEHLTVTQNSFGALISANSAATTTRIRDSQFVRNLQDGVTITNGSSALLIENCSAVGNSGEGFSVGSGSVAVGNRISNNGDVGFHCNDAAGKCALGQNTFAGNNGGGAAAQFTVTALSNMGGNVCLDHAGGTCP